MSFAYWNPALRQQTQLLNAQTGQLRSACRCAGSARRGSRCAASPSRRSGGASAAPAAPLDVWYSAQGEWIGLDSIVAGGRKLSYRLK